MKTLTALAPLAILLIGCGDGGPDLPPDAFIPEPGRVSVRWSIEDENGPTTCEAVGATHVLLRLGLSNGDELQDVWPCVDGQGISSFHEPISYFGQLELVDMFGGLYSSSLETSVSIPPDGSTVMMDDVVFFVQPYGGFSLTVTFPGGNCEGGAEMVGTTLKASNSAGACLTREVAVAAGAVGVAGSYETRCIPDEVDAPCIHADQELSMTDLPSGSYDFTAIGWLGDPPVDCFEARAHIDIAPGQMVNAGAITYMRRSDAACQP